MSTSRMGKVRPNVLVVDPIVQRSLNAKRAKEMAAEFDIDAAGVITVSNRDGDQYIVDGQHRCKAAQLAGHGETPMNAKIYSGLTRVDEAKLFIALNSARIPSATARFKVRLEAQDPVPAAIERIIVEYGWRIGSPGTVGAMHAVHTLETVYNLDPDESRRLFDRTVGLITKVWGLDPDGASAPIFGGVGVFLDRFGDQVDVSALVKKMRGSWGSPVALMGQGKTWKHTRGGRLTLAIAELIHTRYNEKRSTGALTPW